VLHLVTSYLLHLLLTSYFPMIILSSTYNCTVYESKTRNSYCYLWGETTGNRGCKEIVSCMFKYFIEIDSRKDIKSVFLFCDSCPGQNKNRPMFSMLYYVLKYKFSTITNLKITFLLPGHLYASGQCSCYY